MSNLKLANPQPTQHQSKRDLSLTKLGLNKEVLQNTATAGLADFKLTSPLAPVNAAGSRASFAMIAALRAQLLGNESGWKKLNQKGQSLTINADYQISLIVTSGDKDTGIPNSQPSTKNGKGEETKSQVQRNVQLGQTYNLFNDRHDEFDADDILDNILNQNESVDGHELWILLYHFDRAKKELRYELSLPIGITDVGTNGKVKVSSWADRIIFDAIPFDTTLTESESTDFSEDFDFDLTPKDTL